jgi:hypothetical protein
MTEKFLDSPESAAQTVVQQYARWRELFGDTPGKGLSKGQEAGLIGEMVVLIQLIEILGSSALDLWQGPKGARHDFLKNPDSLEVKATMSNQLERVTVHGVEQLLEQPSGTLYLAAFRLEFGAGATTISTLYAELLNRGVDALLLRELLLQVGADPDSVEDWHKWRIAEQRLYRVDNSFPRIIAPVFIGGTIPDGVTDIQYSVTLIGQPVLAAEDVGSAWLSITETE